MLAACGGSGDELTNLLDEASPTTAPTTTVGDTVAAGTSTTSTTSGAETTTTVAGTTTSTTSTTSTTTSTSTSTTTLTTTSTTVAGTTTTAPSPVPFVLRPDGLGAFDFGEVEADAVIPVLVAELGLAERDEIEQYPVSDGAGYVTDDGDLGFTYPIGRTVCFTNGLCLEFGGAVAPTVFVGWVQGPPTAGAALATADGITVGSRWADHLGAMEVFPGGCYSAGWGSTAGGAIELLVISDGQWFGDVTDDGEYVESLPAPGEVRVDSLVAGDRVVFLFADC